MLIRHNGRPRPDRLLAAGGSLVRRFKQGDQVYAPTGLRFGAHARHPCLPYEAVVALKPA